MCPKDTAERISRDAAYNTHILVNAVPQLQWQNNGIWKDIEQLSTDWNDKNNFPPEYLKTNQDTPVF